MGRGYLCNYPSILQEPQSSWYNLSTSLGCFWSKNLSLIVSSYGSGPEINTSLGLVNGLHIIRSLSTKTGKRAISVARREKVDETSSKSISSSSRSNQFDDAQEKIPGIQNLKNFVKFFVIDVETTGFSRKWGRIVEFAVRDLSGGENSYFHTLVNPEQDIQNSHIHRITTDMVNHPHVPRMQDLIPILKQYVRSRQIPGGPAILVAHNGWSFDFPCLIHEFKRCSMAIPSDWLCLDTRSLARELMKSNAPKLPSAISVEELCKYYEIPIVVSAHRAIIDVNLLTSILEKMTFQLKITITGLIERSRSFKALEQVNLKHQKKLPSKKNLAVEKVNLKHKKKLRSKQNP